MQFQYWLEYAQLHKMSLEQDFTNNPSSHLQGQIEATQHLINVANDIVNGAIFLTMSDDNDTMNKTIEGKQMNTTHEHYWDTPQVAEPNLVAECACGEQLEQVTQ